MRISANQGLRAGWTAAVTLLTLASLLGCQAVSTSANQSTKQSGAVSLSNSTLDFGSVTVGASKTLTVSLVNGTSSEILITAAAISDAEFSLSAPAIPAIVNAGQSLPLSIAFKPKATGTPSGMVSITTNTQNLVTLSVSGKGTSTAVGQLAMVPVSISFGSVQTGSSQSQSATLTNTGSATVNITQVTVTGTGFSISGLSAPLTLGPGASTSFTTKFAPVTAGTGSGNIAITSDASNSPLNTPLSGTGVAPGTLSIAPASMAFGSVQVGGSQKQSATLTNSGGSSIVISQATMSGAGFSLSGITLPLTLGAGASSTLSVTFAPQSAGNVSGTATITSNASNPSVTLTATGTGVLAGALTASASSLSFGNVVLGNSQTLPETLTNTGGSTVTITQATATGTGFSLSGLSLPASLGAGQSIAFSVVFKPQSAGTVSGNVAITSNASNSTLNIPLSGTGVTAGTLSPNPSSLSFGSVQIGTGQSLSETVSNTGGSSLTITQATASGSGFSLSGLSLPLSLSAGQSKTFTVTFSPQTSGSASGNVALTSNASNPTLNIPLSGSGVTAGTLAANPASLNFGTVQVGNSSTLSETVTNSGGSTVTVSQLTVSGSGFSTNSVNTPFTLTAGQSLTFSVIYAPTSSGSATGSLTVTSNASNPSLTIALSGTGSAPGTLAVSPSTLSFGNVIVGAQSSLTGTLTATGTSVSVSSVTVNSAEFTVSGLTFPLTVSAGQSATFTVTFAPQATGSATATASFASNASNSPAVESLTGTGTAAPQHSVDLSWTASTSTVTGYNIYRGSTSGGPYTKINNTLNSSTAYTDNSVQAGQAYYYVTTAVDSAGTESIYSNEVQAIVPTP